MEDSRNILKFDDTGTIVQGCLDKSVQHVVLPEGVREIGGRAFENCRSLESINIPNTVTKIGRWAFQDCTSLSLVHINDIEAWCNISFSDNDSNPISYARHLYVNGKEVENLIIPDGVTSIRNYAFSGCNSIISIEFPNSVTSIGSSAFCICGRLETVKFGNSLKKIGNRAFYASSLWYLNIPASVTEIEDYAFENCLELRDVNILDSVEVGTSAFKCCMFAKFHTNPDDFVINWDGIFEPFPEYEVDDSPATLLD